MTLFEGFLAFVLKKMQDANPENVAQVFLLWKSRMEERWEEGFVFHLSGPASAPRPCNRTPPL